MAELAPTLNGLQNSLQTSLVSAGLPSGVAHGLAAVAMQGVATGVGAVAGGGSTAGTAAALGVDANNRQLHPEEKKTLKAKAQDTAKERVAGDDQLTPEQQAAAVGYWYDQLEQAALAQVDDQGKARRDSYLAQVGNTNKSGLEGGFYASNYLADATYAKQLVGQLAQSNTAITNLYGDPLQSGGQPLTAFRATSEQQANSYLLRTPATTAETRQIDNLNSDRLGRYQTTTGTATPDYALEENLLGGAIGGRVVRAVEAVVEGAAARTAAAAEQKAINSARMENNVRADDTLQYVNSTAPINVPASVTRSDNNFYATTNDKGALKTFINERGDLVSANSEGKGSIHSQVRGGNSQSSPLISTTDPASAEAPKFYGWQQIEIDTRNLQRDVNSGNAAQNIKIIPPSAVQEALENRVAEAQRRLDNNLSKNNIDSLKRAIDDLANAQRDGECLISPCVPNIYIKVKN